MLYLEPELVRFAEVPLHPPADFPPYDVFPIEPHRIPASGALSSGKTASAEKGKYMLDEYVETMSRPLPRSSGCRRFAPHRRRGGLTCPRHR